MDDAWENEDAETAKAKPWHRLTQKLKTTIENRSRKDSDADSTVSDLHDFLNTGTGKPQIPKIDIVAARRASDSGLGQVDEYRDDHLQQLQINAKKKILRRAGLRVSFSASEPITIGEGGDDAPDPPFEISRARRQRSQQARYQQRAPTSQPTYDNVQTSRITRKAVPFESSTYPKPDSGIPLRPQYDPTSMPSVIPMRPRGVSNTGSIPDNTYDELGAAPVREHLGNSTTRSNYPSAKGLRRMQEDEGRALITASQRLKFLSPPGSPGHQPSSNNLQIASDRLSFDSDMSGSQHSTSSVTAFPDKLADTGDLQADQHRDVKANTEQPKQSQPEAINPLLMLFADRIAHLKSVFRLSSEIHRPASGSSDQAWARIAMWWFLRSVTSIESIVRSRSQVSHARPMSSQSFATLMQNYVNLAKTWYILIEVLGYNFESPDGSPNHNSRDRGNIQVVKSTLAQHFDHLIVFLDRESLMPPGNLLIQGLDTTMWLEYPNVATEERVALAGNVIPGNVVAQDISILMPLGNSDHIHYFGRAFVRTTLVSKIKHLSIPQFPCLVSMLRLKSDRHLTVVIASQIDLVNVIVSGGDSGGVSWEQVRWMKETNGIRINVGQGLRLILEFAEQDYRLLSSLYSYSFKIISSLKPREDETLAISTEFKTFLYEDSAHPGAFSSKQERNCRGLLFERFAFRYERLQEYHFQWGHRLAISNSSQLRDLRSVSVGLEQHAPVVYEFFSSPEPSVVLHVNQRDRNRRLTITFQSDQDARIFLDHLTGQVLRPVESVTSPIPLSSVSIEAVSSANHLSTSSPRTQNIQWHNIRIIRNRETSAPLRLHLRGPNTSLIDHLLPQSLLIHLDPLFDAQPTLAILRPRPQDSAIVSEGPRPTTPAQIAPVARLAHILFTAPATRRIYGFPDLEALHAFQAALTGWRVGFDSSVDNIRLIESDMDDSVTENISTVARVQMLQHKASGRVQLVVFFSLFDEQREEFNQEQELSLDSQTPRFDASLRIGLEHTTSVEQLDVKPDIVERSGRLGKLRLEKWRGKEKDKDKGRRDDGSFTAGSISNFSSTGFTVKISDAKIIQRSTSENNGIPAGYTILDVPRPRSRPFPTSADDKRQQPQQQQQEQTTNWDDSLDACTILMTFPTEQARTAFTTAVAATLSLTSSNPACASASASTTDFASPRPSLTSQTSRPSTSAPPAAEPDPDAAAPLSPEPQPAASAARGSGLKGFVKRLASS